MSENLKNGLFRGEIFCQEKKITPQKSSFSKMIKCATVMSQDLFQQGWKATKRQENRQNKKFFFSSPCFLGSGIRDPGSGMGKNPDPGSGINIPDPQHWLRVAGRGYIPDQGGDDSSPYIHTPLIKLVLWKRNDIFCIRFCRYFVIRIQHFFIYINPTKPQKKYRTC